MKKENDRPVGHLRSGSIATARGALYPFQVAEAFTALDRELGEIGITAKLTVTRSGYAILVNPRRPQNTMGDKRPLMRRTTESITRIAALYLLSDDWPRQLSQLFPREFTESWDIARGLRPPNIEMSGEFLEVEPAGPDEVLYLQLYYATFGDEVPESVGQVARAAGLEDVRSIESAYNEAFPDNPLTLRIREDLEVLISPP